MTETAAELRRLAAAVEAGRLSPEQRRTVDDVLRSLVLPPVTRAERYGLIIDVRNRFFPGRTDHDASHELESKWGRYAASAWDRDQACECCPHRAGTLNGALWTLTRVWPRLLSADRIRKIVGRDRHLR